MREKSKDEQKGKERLYWEFFWTVKKLELSYQEKVLTSVEVERR